MWRFGGLIVLPMLAAAAAAEPPAPSRIDRLEAWMVAIDRHEPGASDAPARMVRSWTLSQLGELDEDLALVLELIDDPEFPVSWLVVPGWRGPPRRTPYDLADARRLRTLACHAQWRPRRGGRRAAAELGKLCALDPSWRCQTDPSQPTELVDGCSQMPPDVAAHRARNDILRRGAILHTDAALHVGGSLSPLGTTIADRPSRWTLYFEDGRQSDSSGAAFHTDLARMLLSDVRPDPGRDPTVRLWHIATSAWGQRHRWYERHEEHGVELLPEDPQMLLLAGSLHETLASSAIQSMLRAADLPRGATADVGSASSELEKAESLLRRAVSADPALTEARVRLGRVLLLRGHHAQAVELLRQSVGVLGRVRATEDDHVLLYYAELLLGAATEALGRHDQARDAYRRAAALFGDALAPRLALSRLALCDRDRASALAAIQALRSPVDDPVRADPWLRYHDFSGRHADRWLEALYASLEVKR